jgi:hypothetical protein
MPLRRGPGAIPDGLARQVASAAMILRLVRPQAATSAPMGAPAKERERRSPFFAGTAVSESGCIRVVRRT